MNHTHDYKRRYDKETGQFLGAKCQRCGSSVLTEEAMSYYLFDCFPSKSVRTITVELPQPEYDYVHFQSKDQGISIDEVITQALAVYQKHRIGVK